MAGRRKRRFRLNYPPARRIPRRRRRFIRGRDRVGGFYGRFSKKGGELKFHDLDIDDAAIATNGTISQVSCLTIAQGTSESTRIGRKVIVKGINWRFNIKISSQTSAANTTDTVRVILYLDKQTNGATATVTGILESDDFQSFNQLANKSRFRTLMDRTYDLVVPTMADLAGPSTNTGEVVINDTFFKRCNIPIEYDNTFTTGVIGTMRSNNIGVLLLSQGGHAGFDSKMRIRFADG